MNSSASRQPVLRLVGREPDRISRPVRQEIIDEVRAASARRDLDPNDPRWVLASQTALQLQGAALSPARRDNLLKLSHRLGLRPFDANMIIAVVQDEARQNPTSTKQTASTAPADTKRLFPNKQATRRFMDRLRIIPSPKQLKQRQNRAILAQMFISLAVAAGLFYLMWNWLINTT